MQAVIKEFICSSTNAPSISPRGHLRREPLGVDGALYPAQRGRSGGPRDRGGGGQHGQEGGTPDGSSRSLLTGQLQNRPQVLVEHLPYAKERPEHWGYGGQQDKFIV